MIRKNKQTARPLYREIVRDAFAQTWSRKSLWILAVLAGILQTGGLYDVILVSVQRLQEQAQTLLQGGSVQTLFDIRSQLHAMPAFQATITGLNVFQGVLFASLIGLALFVLSLLGQGALTKGLSEKPKPKNPLRDPLAFAAHHLWPLAGLNIFTMATLWLMRFLVLLPFSYAIAQATYLSVILYFVTFVLFLIAAVALTAIHLFALQAMVLDEEHLLPAITHAARLVWTDWAIVLETGATLFVVGVGILLASLTAYVVMLIPLFLLLVTAALMQYWSFVSLGVFLATTLFFVVLIAAASFTITFQYAAWQRLYLRLEEGTAFAKISRLVRRLVHGVT